MPEDFEEEVPEDFSLHQWPQEDFSAKAPEKDAWLTNLGLLGLPLDADLPGWPSTVLLSKANESTESEFCGSAALRIMQHEHKVGRITEQELKDIVLRQGRVDQCEISPKRFDKECLMHRPAHMLLSLRRATLL